MLGSCASRSACQANHLPCFHLITHLDKVLRLVAVESLKAIAMLDAYAVPIACKGATFDDNAVKCCDYSVVGLGLNVYTRVTTWASKGADDMTSRQRICPAFFLNIGEIEFESVGIFKWIFRVYVFVFAFLLAPVGIIGALHGYVDKASVLCTQQSFLAEFVALQFDNDFRSDASAIHHNGKFTVGFPSFTAHNGYRLPGIDLLSHLHEVLGVVSIDGFEAIVVAYDDDISIAVDITREANSAGKHGFYGITFFGLDFQSLSIVDDFRLSNGQRKGVIVGFQGAEINADCVRMGEESWRRNADLLLFGRRKCIFRRCIGRCDKGQKNCRSNICQSCFHHYMLWVSNIFQFNFAALAVDMLCLQHDTCKYSARVESESAGRKIVFKTCISAHVCCLNVLVLQSGMQQLQAVTSL